MARAAGGINVPVFAKRRILGCIVPLTSVSLNRPETSLTAIGDMADTLRMAAGLSCTPSGCGDFGVGFPGGGARRLASRPPTLGYSTSALQAGRRGGRGKAQSSNGRASNSKGLNGEGARPNRKGQNCKWQMETALRARQGWMQMANCKWQMANGDGASNTRGPRKGIGGRDLCLGGGMGWGFVN